MKYAYEAKRHLDWTHKWQAEVGETTETCLAIPLIAQAFATLALAEQQRIANLIAWSTANGTEPSREVAIEIARAIK